MGVQIMKYLISQQGPMISSDIIEFCALRFVDADQTIILMNATPGSVLGPETVEAASFYRYYFFDILAAFREHDPNVPIPGSALHKII